MGCYTENSYIIELEWLMIMMMMKDNTALNLGLMDVFDCDEYSMTESDFLNAASLNNQFLRFQGPICICQHIATSIQTAFVGFAVVKDDDEDYDDDDDDDVVGDSFEIYVVRPNFLIFLIKTLKIHCLPHIIPTMYSLNSLF